MAHDGALEDWNGAMNPDKVSVAANVDFLLSYLIHFLCHTGCHTHDYWAINDKGNRVWFSYEHTPTLFPVTETRFYKPKLHKMDFLGKRKKEEDGRNI